MDTLPNNPVKLEQLLVSLFRTADRIVRARMKLSTAELAKMTVPHAPHTQEGLDQVQKAYTHLLDAVRKDSDPIARKWLEMAFGLGPGSPIALVNASRELEIRGQLGLVVIDPYNDLPTLEMQILHPVFYVKGVMENPERIFKPDSYLAKHLPREVVDPATGTPTLASVFAFHIKKEHRTAGRLHRYIDCYDLAT